MADISGGQLKVLEKLIGDEEFRSSFLEDPDAAIAKVGIDLNEEELAGLKGIDWAGLSGALSDLDARLSKSAAAGAMGTASDAASSFVSVVAQFFGTTTSV
jgi:putative modified peptide